MNILVLDDEPSIVQMCVKVLQSQGHTVQGFTKATDALAHLEAAPADLLVVDYKMPELTGLDFESLPRDRQQSPKKAEEKKPVEAEA